MITFDCFLLNYLSLILYLDYFKPWSDSPLMFFPWNFENVLVKDFFHTRWAPQLYEAFQNAVEVEKKDIGFDLSRISWISSCSGKRELSLLMRLGEGHKEFF